MAATGDVLDDIIQNLESLNVGEKGKELNQLKVGQESKEKDGEEKEDDGYDSSSSTEILPEKVGEEGDEDEGVEENEKDEKKSEDEDGDDERILEPLVILKDEYVGPEVEFTSRGPVSMENSENRFQPYSRPHPHHQGLTQSPDKQDEEKPQPIPNVLIYKKSERERPTKIDVKIAWSDKHELCIEKYQLPEDTWFTDGTNRIQLFIQLNPNIKDTKSFLADVKVYNIQLFVCFYLTYSMK